MKEYLWVGLGGGLGSVLRHALSVFSLHRWGMAFPYGTLLVNVTGSFVIGLFAVLCGPGGRWEVPLPFWQWAVIGFLGGFTTFSSFSLQTLELVHRGEPWAAAGNVGLNLFGCLLAVAGGFWLGLALNR